MRASTLVASLVLGGGILAGGTVLVPALAQTHLGIHDAGVAIPRCGATKVTTPIPIRPPG